MENRRWVNPTQPQTLQIAVFLLYINAFFSLLYGGLGSPYGVAIVAGSVAAGFGIANERKWGYGLGVAMALLPFAWAIAHGINPLGGDVINLLFEIALVALLLHPRILLIDEPSLGLDPRMVELVFSTIVAVNRAGTAVLMVEQNARQALAISHRGFVLELGRNRFEGTGRALLENPDVRAHYLGG